MQSHRTPREGAKGYRVWQDKRTGKWRAVATNPITGKQESASKVLGLGDGSFRTKTEAKKVGAAAAERMGSFGRGGNVTVGVLRERWLARTHTRDGKPIKDSTTSVNTSRTKGFAERYENTPIGLIDERDWIDYRDHHGGRPSHLEALKVMFGWATTTDGSRLLDRNPFADLTVAKGRGNARKNPPSPEEIEDLLRHAYELLPAYGAWLEFACFTGARPAEIDALRWTDLAADGSEVHIRRQFSTASRKFTTPKNGLERTVELNARAQQAVERMRRVSLGRSQYIFANTLGRHFTTAGRAWYWQRAAAKVRWENEQPTCYLATRHFAGWFMVNRLDLTSEEVADALGHEDHGQLVRKLYGHRDQKRNRRRVADAYDRYQAEQREQRKRGFNVIDGEA